MGPATTAAGSANIQTPDMKKQLQQQSMAQKKQELEKRLEDVQKSLGGDVKKHRRKRKDQANPQAGAGIPGMPSASGMYEVSCLFTILKKNLAVYLLF